MKQKKHNFLFIIFLIFSQISLLHSQELFFSIGKNFTHYDYKNSKGLSNPNVKDDVGNGFSVGFIKSFNDCRCQYANLSYGAQLTLNEFNATGGNGIAYNWKTQYIGLQPSGYFSFFPYSNFDIISKIGINFSTILNGKQSIGGNVYDLTKIKEFSGFWIAPVIGLNVKYSFTSSGYLSLDYSFLKSFNLTNQSSEKLSFNTNQLQFGVHFTIN